MKHSSDPEQNLPTSTSSTSAKDHPEQADSCLVEGSVTSTSGHSSHTSTAARSVERTSDLITFHAHRLRESKELCLRVVIRPGAGLQLSLELNRADELIRVRAEVNRGKFNFLREHWSAIQHELEGRGIRVAVLTAPGHPGSSGADSSDDDAVESFGDFDFAGTKPLFPRTSYRKRDNGWEGWA